MEQNTRKAITTDQVAEILNAQLKEENERIEQMAEQAIKDSDKFIHCVRDKFAKLTKEDYLKEVEEIQLICNQNNLPLFRTLLNKLTDNTGVLFFLNMISDGSGYFRVAEKVGIEKKRIDEIIHETAVKIAKELNTPDFIYPDTFYDTKTNVANKLFSCLQMDEATIVPYNDDKKGKPIIGTNVYYTKLKPSLDLFEKKFPYIKLGGGNLSEGNRLILAAVITLMEAGNYEFSSLDIIRTYEGHDAQLTDTKACYVATKMLDMLTRFLIIYTKPDDEGKWNEAVSKMIGRKVIPLKEKNESVDDMYAGQLLQFEITQTKSIKRKEKDNEGNEIENTYNVPIRWKMLQMPKIHEFGKALKQVASTPIHMLDTSLESKKGKKGKKSRTERVNILANYILRRISTMKKDSSFSKVIKDDSLYEVAGIEATNESSLRVYQKNTRDSVKFLLDSYKKNGLFCGYTEKYKSTGRTKRHYAFEIFLTKDQEEKASSV